MNFPDRDLSNQFISRSYQDVVQQYLNTGSLLYLLDGYGNVIFQIPSASYGGIVLTQDQSASYALQAFSASYAPGNPSISASYALTASFVLGFIQSASFALSSSNSLTASNAISASNSITSSYSFFSTSASYAFSSSYAISSTMSDVATLAEMALTASLADTASIAISASYSLSSSYAFTSAQSVSSSFASSSISASYALTASYAITASYVSASNIDGTVLSASYSLTSSNSLTASYLLNQSPANLIISPDTQSFIVVNTHNISSSIDGLRAFTFHTQSNINAQNGSASFEFNGRLSGSNVNVGVPNDSYPWGTSLVGSFFSSWNSDTNVSDILRFFAGAFSSSYPNPTPNTKTQLTVTASNNLGGSTVTINGIVPNSSSNANILYLQPLGWASVGNSIFGGFTFKNGTGYMYYGGTATGSTVVSSSLGSLAFGLGPLTNGNITQVNLSGSFNLVFASSSNGTVNYTSSTEILVSRSSQNLTTSIAAPIAVNSIPSANVAVIPSVYQDGYFNNFSGSNLTNSIVLSSISSSGWYKFSGSVGINSGSSPYNFFTPSPTAYYYTPLADNSFSTNSITAPNSSGSSITAFSRSMSGAPYLTTGSTYKYVVTASGAFSPLYLNGTVSSISIPTNALTLTTQNSTSLSTNPTIQTPGVVKSSDYTTTRATGTYPLETDVIVFDVTLGSTGTGSNASASGSTFSTYVVSDTTFNRANSGTVIGSQTFNVHIPGTFGQPSSSGSLLYFGRPDGYVISTLSFSSTPNSESFFDEANRILLNDNMTGFTGSAFNSSSLLGISELQVKPGFLVNPSANAAGHTGYWYSGSYGTNFKYYVRRFQTTAVVNTLKLALTGSTTLVSWNTASANSMAIALLFESGNKNIYSNCRVYDVSNTSQNLIQSGITTSDLSISGTNPFTSSIDLYGNNGSGASVSSGTILFPMRSADGAILDSTDGGKDEVYVIVRYNGTPATPLSTITISKFS